MHQIEAGRVAGQYGIRQGDFASFGRKYGTAIEGDDGREKEVPDEEATKTATLKRGFPITSVTNS